MYMYNVMQVEVKKEIHKVKENKGPDGKSQGE